MRFAATWVMAAAAAAIAPAQTTAPAAHQPIPRANYLGIMDSEFRKMDADKNGSVTRTEIEQFQTATAVAVAQSRGRALFAQLDSDRNGQLSPAEFAKLPIRPPPPNAAPLLTQLDLDKNQSISLVEYRTVKLANFDKIDADKDGVASVAEMRAAKIIK
jgi:Ca2+-binding EF-hand superfamily protein